MACAQRHLEVVAYLKELGRAKVDVREVNDIGRASGIRHCVIAIANEVGNSERIAYFLGQKDRAGLSAKTNAAKLDDARAGLMSAVAALRMA